MSLIVHAIDDGVKDPCCVCGEPTEFWYEPRDVPLCWKCANKKDVTLRVLPSKEIWAKRYNNYTASGSVA